MRRPLKFVEITKKNLSYLNSSVKKHLDFVIFLEPSQNILHPRFDKFFTFFFFRFIVMPTHNFKKPAPAPPTTPRLRTPMKPVVKKDLATSTLIAFDDLMRDGSVFFPGSEKEFLKFVQNVKSLQRNFRSSEEERKRLKHGEQEWFKEREALKWQLKQAQQLLNQENAEKRYVEKEKENLQK